MSRHFLVAACLILALHSLRASGADHVVLISGLGGESKFSQEFAETLATLRAVLVEKHGYDAATVHFLAESPDAAAGVNASSTLEEIERVFEALKSASPDDTLLVVLVGHGQSDYQEAKFNLPGKDLTPDALKILLDALPFMDQRLILSFPCSGQFSAALGRAGRVILASTDGPRQIFRAQMTQYLNEAFTSDFADGNGDGNLSVYELFEFLSDRVEGYFISTGSLQTENPSLEDNGDGRVTTLAEGMDAGDGERAKEIQLTPASGAQTPPETPDERPPDQAAAPTADAGIPARFALVWNVAAGAPSQREPDDAVPLGQDVSAWAQELRMAWEMAPESVEAARPYVRLLVHQEKGDDAILILRSLEDAPETDLLWGEAYGYGGEIALARGHLEDIAPANETAWAAAQRLLLRLDYLMGDIKQAERRCRGLLDVQPLDKEARIILSRIRTRYGDYEEADSVLDAVAGAYPEDIALLEARAVVAEAAGHRDKARRLRQSVVPLVTSSPPATASGLAAAAAALRALDEPKAAAQCLQKAMEFYPADPFLLLEKAKLRLSIADTLIAATAAGDVLKRYEECPLALNTMADVYWVLRKDATAVEVLCDRALAADPTLLEARCSLIRQRLIAGDWTDAAALLKENREVNSRHMETEHLVRAMEILRGSLAEEGGTADDTALSAMLGELLAARAEYQASSTWYRQALKVEKPNSAILKGAGLAEFRCSRFDASYELLDTAFALNPFDAGTKNMLDLLDTVREAMRFETDDVAVYFAPGDQATAQFGLFLASQYLDAGAKRLNVQPKQRLRVQLCDSRDDINIITQGIPASCATGCSPFGSLYFESTAFLWTPKAAGGREPNYRYDEAIHRGVTEFLVDRAAGAGLPRWFRDGFARHEAWTHNPEWAPPHLELLVTALRAGAEFPLDRLEREYLGERNALARTYSALVVRDWVETLGYETVRTMLDEMGAGKPWEGVIEAAHGATLDAVNRDTHARIDRRFSGIRIDEPQNLSVNALAAEGTQTDQGRLELAAAYFHAKRNDDALRTLAPMLAVEAPPSRALLLAGRIAAAEGEYAKARDRIALGLQLEQLRNESTATAESYAAYGEALAKLGESEQAAEAFREAMRLNPLDHSDTGPSAQLLALLDKNSPRPAEYYEVLEKRLAADRTDARGRFLLAQWYESRQDLTSALRWYGSAAGIRPDWMEAHQSLAAAAEATENYALAIASYKTILTMRPGNLRIQQRLDVCEDIIQAR